jgi:hypothetical protein
VLYVEIDDCSDAFEGLSTVLILDLLSQLAEYIARYLSSLSLSSNDIRLSLPSSMTIFI